MALNRLTYPDKSASSENELEKKFFDTEANEIKSVVNATIDKVEELDENQLDQSPNPYYGRWDSLLILQQIHPTGELNAFAIIDPGAGVTPQVAAWDDVEGIWELTGASDKFVFLNSEAQLPPIGQEQIDYITLNDMKVRVWHINEYLIKSPQGQDSNNITSSQLIRFNEAKLNNFTYPDWFNGIKIPVVYKDGKFVTDYDIETPFQSLILTETPYYISPNGSNSNDGLTPQTALASVTQAGVLNAKLIYVLPGVYQYNTFPSLTSAGFDGLPNGDVAIIGLGEVKVTAYRPSSQHPFTDQGGGVWMADNDTYANLTDSVVDLELKDKFGYDLLYTQKLTLTEVQNEEYTWFFDTVNLDIYVNIGTGRTMQNGTNVVVNTNSVWGIRSDSGKLFLKNMEFMDRLDIRSATSASVFSIYMKNIRSLQPKRHDFGAIGLNGFAVESANAYLQDCVSSRATLDCFNYHNALGASNLKILELNCKGAKPSFGREGGSNQASSGHSDNNNISITRVNGYYDGGNASVIADVNNNAQSVLIGCSIIQENDVDPTTTNGGGFRGVDAYLFGCYLSENASITGITPNNHGTIVEKCVYPDGLATTGTVTIIK